MGRIKKEDSCLLANKSQEAARKEDKGKIMMPNKRYF